MEVKLLFSTILRFPPTYETALMRHFYNGRTETVRSCTLHSVNWILSFLNATHSVTNLNYFHNLILASLILTRTLKKLKI